MPPGKVTESDLVWDDLRTFLFVARLGQIQKAAKALGVDHSTVSRKLTRLESVLKMTLFDRAARRLKITPEGARLLETAKSMEATILREVYSLSDRQIGISGRVRVGAPQGLGTYFLASRLPGLTLEYPNLELELCSLPRNYSLASREADIVITMERPKTGSLRYKKLTDYTLGLYASPKYTERSTDPIEIQNLNDHNWCGYIDELLYTPALDLLKFDEIEIVPRYRCVDVISQIEAICSGSVIGLLPCFVAKRRGGLVRLLAKEISITRPYYLVIHEDLANFGRVRLVMERLESWIRTEKSRFQPSDSE